MPRKAKLSPLQKYSRKLYANLKKRIEERKDKNGRIIRHGQPIPFTEEQLFGWLDVIFNPATLCRYCLIPITILDCAIDHEIPLSRGGSAGLDNLIAICREDNQYKGKLLPGEFLQLRTFLQGFPDEARRDIEGRLKKAVKLAASARWAMKKKTKGALLI